MQQSGAGVYRTIGSCFSLTFAFYLCVLDRDPSAFASQPVAISGPSLKENNADGVDGAPDRQYVYIYPSNPDAALSFRIVRGRSSSSDQSDNLPERGLSYVKMIAGATDLPVKGVACDPGGEFICLSISPIFEFALPCSPAKWKDSWIFRGKTYSVFKQDVGQSDVDDLIVVDTPVDDTPLRPDHRIRSYYSKTLGLFAVSRIRITTERVQLDPITEIPTTHLESIILSTPSGSLLPFGRWDEFCKAK